MKPVRSLMSMITATLLVTIQPSLRAQSVDVSVAVNQSFMSAESIGSPTGWRVGLHAPAQLGRFGFQAGYRYVSERLGEIPGYCGAFDCVDGPFDQTSRLRTLDFGLMYAVVPGLRSNVHLGVSGAYSWQDERLRHLTTGDVSSRASVGPDFGLGVFAEARVPPLALGFQPLAYARYDRISGSQCIPDASCFGGRNVATLGVGIAWGMR